MYDTTDNTGKTKGDSKIIRIDEQEIRSHLDRIVKGTVEDTLNSLLDAEADAICQAGRYERTPDRLDTRAGYYSRKLQTKAGEVQLKVPKLRKLPFETAIIERYRRRESSVEEALVEMYLAGVSVRRVEDITEALWGTRISPSTVSDLNKKIYGRIDDWRNRPIRGEHPYVFLDGIWQRCIVHFYRNVYSAVPKGKAREVSLMLKAIHNQEDLKAAREKAEAVVEKLKAMKLQKAAKIVQEGYEETLSYFHFPSEHWKRLRTNNSLERLNREIRRRTKVVGNFPDGESALMLVSARVRHVASTKCGKRAYMNMEHLREQILEQQDNAVVS
jgi:transposase-like protein